MRAIVQDRYGDERRSCGSTDVPDPVAGPGEVLVRVGAAGVDRGTWHAMTGLPLAARLALGLRGPRDRTPGRDVAGTVDGASARASPATPWGMPCTARPAARSPSSPSCR